jgi:uncharacterized alkaline shock family protein YloU
MNAKIEKELGLITIDNKVIASIAGLAATDCYGVVGMAVKNMRDGIVHLLKKSSLSKGVALTVEEDEVKIELHIIVEYGTNIPAIAETISSTVKYRVEEATGLKVASINIFVEGIRVDG